MSIVGQIHHKREIIQNKYKENLVGILHETGSKQVVIVCHGYRSCKDKIPMVNRNLAVAFANKGISAFRFDFAGNGNNYREVDDLRLVIQCLEQEKRFVTAIIGYNKGGNVVLFYALRFKDVKIVVNISSRFDLKRGIEGRLGKDYLKGMKQYGFIDVANRKGAAYQLIPQNPQAQSRTYEINTPSSGSKDLVSLTYNIMPFDLPSLSLLLLYLVLFSLERYVVHPLVALENIVFYHERAARMYLLLPYALAQVTGITKIRWVSGSGNLGESDGLDSSIFTKAWVDSAGSEGLKDHSAIDGHEADKAMVVFEFLDFKRKNKIRSFMDRLIERHMAMKTDTKSGDSSYASKDSQKETRDARDMLSVSI
nr:alpha/beta hydrolases superfamily protein [Tanacetum cinerariifolium]